MDCPEQRFPCSLLKAACTAGLARKASPFCMPVSVVLSSYLQTFITHVDAETLRMAQTGSQSRWRPREALRMTMVVLGGTPVYPHI